MQNNARARTDSELRGQPEASLKAGRYRDGASAVPDLHVGAQSRSATVVRSEPTWQESGQANS